MKFIAFSIAVVVGFIAWSHIPVSYAADGSSISAVNSSVHARDGETYEKLSTVNGDVHVGRGSVAAEAKTVNGSITLDSDARVGTATTVNGSLRIREGVTIENNATTVNGSIDVGKRARIGGDLATVSGDIDIEGAEIAGGLRTNNGDIELSDGAHVRGGILVKKNNGWNWGREEEPVKVRVCATCVVDGELRAERKVELYVENGGRVGQISGEVVRK